MWHSHGVKFSIQSSQPNKHKLDHIGWCMQLAKIHSIQR